VPELGPVVFPAYAGTDVSLRSRQVAVELTGRPELVHSLRRVLAAPAMPPDPRVDPAVAADVARLLLFGERAVDRARQIDRVRRKVIDGERALTASDIAALTGLLAQLAAADAGIDPLCDALCDADDALDAAATLISTMLGVSNPDPEDQMNGSPAGSMPANSADPVAPPAGHPTGEVRTEETSPVDAPPAPPEAPIDPAVMRASYLRRAYLQTHGVKVPSAS
jgi:hypothetical protein